MPRDRRPRIPGHARCAHFGPGHPGRRAEALAGVSLTRPRPLDLAPCIQAPTLIVHGANDALVTLADAQRLADAFPDPAPLIEVPGARHTDIVDIGGPELIDRIATFLDEAVAR